MTHANTKDGSDDIRVLIVDSSAMLREALAELMRLLPGLRHVGSASTAADGVKLVRKECPDAVLVDSSLPDSTGARAVQLFRAAYPPVRIIGYSIHPDDSMRQRLLNAGADAFVGKDGGVDELIGVIRKLGLVPEPDRSACEKRAKEVA